MGERGREHYNSEDSMYLNLPLAENSKNGIHVISSLAPGPPQCVMRGNCLVSSYWTTERKPGVTPIIFASVLLPYHPWHILSEVRGLGPLWPTDVGEQTTSHGPSATCLHIWIQDLCWPVVNTWAAPSSAKSETSYLWWRLEGNLILWLCLGPPQHHSEDTVI